MKTSKFVAIALGVVIAAGMTSCKSKESLYKKAYEKAQAMNQTQAPVVTPTTTTPTIIATPVQTVVPQTPVTTTTVTTPVQQEAEVATRSESLQLVDGAGLKAYSVVCGSFGLKANAVGLQNKLKGQGYQAQIALHPQRNLYRVIASTYDDKASAATSRRQLLGQFPDAWVLYNK